MSTPIFKIPRWSFLSEKMNNIAASTPDLNLCFPTTTHWPNTFLKSCLRDGCPLSIDDLVEPGLGRWFGVGGPDAPPKNVQEVFDEINGESGLWLVRKHDSAPLLTCPGHVLACPGREAGPVDGLQDWSNGRSSQSQAAHKSTKLWFVTTVMNGKCLLHLPWVSNYFPPWFQEGLLDR